MLRLNAAHVQNKIKWTNFYLLMLDKVRFFMILPIKNQMRINTRKYIFLKNQWIKASWHGPHGVRINVQRKNLVRRLIKVLLPNSWSSMIQWYTAKRIDEKTLVKRFIHVPWWLHMSAAFLKKWYMSWAYSRELKGVMKLVVGLGWFYSIIK